MENDKLYEKFKNLTQDEIDQKFIRCCISKDLNVIKYLLNSKDLKVKANVHAENDCGFRLACQSNNLEIVKYLLTSPELKNRHSNIHSNNDYGFINASINNHINITQFLIFDMNIEKTESIQKYLKEINNEQVEKMFKLRDLNKQLGEELKSDKIKVKKVKL